MTTPTVPESLAHHEHHDDDPADRFHRLDLAAIARYDDGTAGIIDSFDCLDAATFTATAHEEGVDATNALVNAYFGMLSDWWEKLDSLYADLSNRGPACHMGAAGRRYITAETNRFFHVLNLTRREACRYAFGTAGPAPAVDAGMANFCDVYGLTLDGTALAESR